MTIKASSSQCPVDHSEDPELVQSFYRTVRSYALPRFPNIAVKTVHRWQQHLTGTVSRLVLCTALSVSQSVFTITEKAPTRAFSWLKATTSAIRQAAIRHYANIMHSP